MKSTWPECIKDIEHQQHVGLSFVGWTRNVFMKRDDGLPTLKHINNMFKNTGKKTGYRNFWRLNLTFNTLSLQHPEKSFIYSVWDSCWDTTIGVEMKVFTCQNMEADTILLYIFTTQNIWSWRCCGEQCRRHWQHGFYSLCSPCSLCSPLWIKRKRDIHDCKTLCSADVADVIVPFHIYTGTDEVSSFHRSEEEEIYL